ncbi:MAG: cyclase family protein [Actinomycetota bacterium]
MPDITLFMRRRRILSFLAGASILPALGNSSASAEPYQRGIPAGYGQVDPRTARRVPLWHELNSTNPTFPGDPEFRSEVFTTIEESGYLLEQVTSLGTHTGTHIDAPAHFVEGAARLSELDESWTLMPLFTLDLRARIASQGANFTIGLDALKAAEARYGRIPTRGCVVLFTGLSARFTSKIGPGSTDDYFDAVPGFTAGAVEWLFERRNICALGSDTFGPDATSDENFTATATALAQGGVVVPNLSDGLRQMRPYGDWISVNGPRLKFSGFPVGVTGFTLR